MKKIAALALAVVMLFSLCITAYAAEEKGSITVNSVTLKNDGTPVATYKLYQLLDLESYNHTTGAYSYKVNADWAGFFASADALSYVNIDAAGYVTWINGEDDESVATFAKLALAYAEDNGIAPVKSSANDGEFVVSVNSETGIASGVFSDLNMGYFLVDTSMGALCGLTTTNPHASINAKNGISTIDKQVMEDSTSQWAEHNTADIGQTVQFRTTINVAAGAEDFILHDQMSAGFNFDKVTKIEHIVPSTSTTTELTAGTDYTVTTSTHGCTFEIIFDPDFCASLEANDKIVVFYQAMLNRNAVIAGNGNPNETWLEYGAGHTTPHDTTYTYTYGFDIIKTDSQNTLIDGATFRIYDAAVDGNEVEVVLMDDGVTYRRAREDETGVKIIVKNGQVRVVGFDNGTYYLQEIDAPEGYNKLTARQKFIISEGNLDAIFNDGIYSSGSGVHVVNKTGSMLPETGAMGTMMFVTFGTILVLAAGVLLVTKKRMSMIED